METQWPETTLRLPNGTRRLLSTFLIGEARAWRGAIWVFLYMDGPGVSQDYVAAYLYFALSNSTKEHAVGGREDDGFANC
jgi:hypothetical protein